MASLHHKTLRSPRKKERRRKQFRLTAIFVVLCVVTLVVGLSYTTHSDILALSSIEIKGNEAVEESNLMLAVEEVLSRNYFLFFSKKNIFLYPRRALERSLLQSFERLESVAIERDDNNTLVITVQERTPHGLWCDTIETTTANDGGMKVGKRSCYFLDEKGFIFSEAPSFSGDLFFTYSGSIEQEQPFHEGPNALVKPHSPIGSRFMNAREFQQVALFLEALRDLGFTPVALHNDGADLTIVSRRGVTVLVSRKQDFAVTLQNLQSFLSEGSQGGPSVISFPDEFTSIDARFGNKVFFKRK